MYLRFLFFFILLFSHLFAWELNCPYGCGQAETDPDIEYLSWLFAESLEELEFQKTTIIFFPHGSIDLEWHVEIDEKWLDDNLDLYEFVRTTHSQRNIGEFSPGFPDPLLPEWSKQKFILENYSQFLNALSLVHSDLKSPLSTGVLPGNQ